jgi:hypothetical protein
MKKTTLLTFAFIAITFASCKKDRVCTCTSDQAGAKAQKVTYLDASKGSATAACLSYKTDYSVGTTTTTVKVTCALD